MVGNLFVIKTNFNFLNATGIIKNYISLSMCCKSPLFIPLIKKTFTASSKFHAGVRRVPDVSLILCCWKHKIDAVCYFENTS